MCPICVLTSVVYGICWVLGFFGLTKVVKYIKIKYHIWSGTKCDKCKSDEGCQSHN